MSVLQSSITYISFVISSIEIDYEYSLDAPSVLKAIKSLRRSVKKLSNCYEELELEDEHISLYHVGWAQGGRMKDQQYVRNLKNQSFQVNPLYFCGDAYGPSYNPDENLMQSVLEVSSAIGDNLTKGE